MPGTLEHCKVCFVLLLHEYKYAASVLAKISVWILNWFLLVESIEVRNQTW